MVGEANKTAEYFYGTEFIAEEGARIASMIKNSSYMIAFTCSQEQGYLRLLV